MTGVGMSSRCTPWTAQPPVGTRTRAIYQPMAEGIAKAYAADPAVAGASLGEEDFAWLFVAVPGGATDQRRGRAAGAARRACRGWAACRAIPAGNRSEDEHPCLRGTSSGKTTVARALLSLTHSAERLVTIKDARELHLPHENSVALIAERSEVSERTPAKLLVAALRMRPDRLILGEMRGTSWSTQRKRSTLSFKLAVAVAGEAFSKSIHQRGSEVEVGQPFPARRWHLRAVAGEEQLDVVVEASADEVGEVGSFEDDADHAGRQPPDLSDGEAAALELVEDAQDLLLHGRAFQKGWKKSWPIQAGTGWERAGGSARW